MVLWDPEESDWSQNRVDWLVWAITDFMLTQRPVVRGGGIVRVR